MMICLNDRFLHEWDLGSYSTYNRKAYRGRIGIALMLPTAYAGCTTVVRHAGLSGAYHTVHSHSVQLPSTNSALKCLFLGGFS